MECDSAIGLHLLQTPDCAAHYHDRQILILAKARTQYHLATQEAIFIKAQKPIVPAEKKCLLPPTSTVISHYNNITQYTSQIKI